MKKILFVIPSLKIGGIENALVNLLEHFDYSRYEVHLFVFHYDYSQVSRLNSNVKVIHGAKLLNTAAMTMNEAKEKSVGTKFIRILLAILCKTFGARTIYNIIFAFEKQLVNYDVAISYSNNVNTNSTYYGSNLFTLKRVRAKKKIAWLHVDYEAMNMDNKINNSEYQEFDKIIAVSEAVKESISRVIPSISNKTETVYNVLPVNEKQIKSTQSNNVPVIVTVGRLDPNKNQIECVNISEKLRRDGLNFKWLLVGDGQDKQTLLETIAMKGLSDFVEITGYIDNVQEVLKTADIFVSTSLSESYGMAVVEAQQANVPVVVKRYPAASEIINGSNGIIVDDYKEMYAVIKNLLMDVEAYKIIKKNTVRLHDDDYSMNKLYAVIEE